MLIETGETSSQCRYFKAKVLDSHKMNGINEVVIVSLDEKSIVFTDKSTSYVDISNYVELHVTEKSNERTTKETLRWVHITISNAKRNLLGNYHKIKGKYLQLFLDEFVYKLNRRYFKDRMYAPLKRVRFKNIKKALILKRKENEEIKVYTESNRLYSKVV